MALKLKGSTSGFVGLDAPSVAGNNTLILPENSGSAFQLFANDITAGVTTFTTVTVNRNGDLTVPGTISIGGTLTYEDVTSVDSIGIVTARGLSIFGNTSGLNVTGVGTFVNGSISLTSGGAERLNIASPSGGHVLIKNPSAASLSFGTNDTERLSITSAGKVGIGTDNPTSDLHLKGTGGNTSGLRLDNSHDNVSAYFQDNNDNSDFLITYSGTGGAELTIHADGNLGLNEANGDDVLIGTSSVIDNSKLTIVKAAAGFTTAIALGNGSASGDGSKIIATKSLVLSADYDNNNSADKSYLGFETDGTERLRITSTGLVGIGIDNPQSILHIEHSTPGIRLSDTGNSSAYAFFDANAANAIIHADKGNTVSDSRVAFAVDNNEKMRIGSSGQIGIAGANYGTAGQVLQSNGSSSAVSWANPVTPHAFVQMDSQYFTSTSTILQFNSNTSNDKSFGVTIDRTNERFQPTVAGVYHVIGILEFNHAGPGASTFTLGLLKNGSSSQVMRRLINYNGGFYDHITVQGMIFFNGSSDYVDMRADHNAGGNAIMTTNSTLSMHRVGS